MDNQRKAEFTRRPGGKPLVVARHYESGEPLKSPVEIGDVRDLKIDEEVVYVEVIDDLENGKFKGAIVSFDSSPEGIIEVTRPGIPSILKKLMYGLET